MASLSLKHINKTYPNGFEAVKDFNLEIEDKEFIIFVGPSGCGKSTTLRMIAGLEEISGGTLKIGDKVMNDVEPKDRDIAMVFQNYALYPHMTVYDNMAFGLKLRKVPKDQIDKAVREAARILDLEKLLDRKPKALSGGQRQRVAFARALAPNPQLLLLDEPFAAIDAKIRTELRSWLKDMIEKLGITSIFVTHDQDEAIEVADEIIITNRGRIEQKGTPLEVYQNPDTAFTAGFFGQTSVIDDYQVFNHFEEVPGGEKAIVRPEFVKVTKKNEEQKYKSSATEGIVERVAFRGSSLKLKVRVGNTILSARRSLDEEPVLEGEVVDVFVQRIFVTKGNEAVLLHNTAMVEDWLVI